MKEHAFRLIKNQDLKLSIQEYCLANRIKSASISTCVGCVYKLRLRVADGKTIKQWDNPFEIVSLVGTIAQGKAHIHFSGSDEKGICIGGHLVDGTLVNTTAEIVLIEIENVEFSREFDDKTQYDELVIKSFD